MFLASTGSKPTALGPGDRGTSHPPRLIRNTPDRSTHLPQPMNDAARSSIRREASPPRFTGLPKVCESVGSRDTFFKLLVQAVWELSIRRGTRSLRRWRTRVIRTNKGTLSPYSKTIQERSTSRCHTSRLRSHDGAETQGKRPVVQSLRIARHVAERLGRRAPHCPSDRQQFRLAFRNVPSIIAANSAT